jgi:hypothetical protein
MSTTPKITGSLVTALAAIALAAPGAGAMPVRGPVGGPSEFDAGHASVAQEAAAARAAAAAQVTKVAQPKQDLRSPDAKDAALHPQGVQIGRGSRAPSWPIDPKPIHATTQTSPDGDDIPWLAIVLGVTGAVALGGAAAGVTHSTRLRTRRARAVV